MAISKLMKGSGFAGCLNYVLDKEEAEVLDTSCVSSEDPSFIAREMRAVADSASLSKPVLHLAMSAPHGETVSDDQWRIAARTWLREMGADPDTVQYILVRHRDREHDHVHMVANRILLDGKVIRDQQDYRRSHAAMRVAEREAGMQAFEKQTREATKGRMVELRREIDNALASNSDFASFKQALEDKSIKVLVNQQSTGRIAGLSFVASGHVYKGSSLGKAYSMPGLQKRGLEFQNNQSERATRTPLAAISRQAKFNSGQLLAQQDPDKNKRDIASWLAQRAVEAHRLDQSSSAEGQTEQELE